jgi:anaerobic magnesium-protoporphyrin IX monomethyl ester cyclase
MRVMERILLINVPSRKGSGGFVLPLGLLYLGGIIERCGHEARILDPYLKDLELKEFDENFDEIDKIICEYKPSIIGYGGIGSSYGRTKRLVKHVKAKNPGILQIAGGPLASVYKYLLPSAGIDLVFHGETEVSFPLFLSKYVKGEPYFDTPGISYLKDGEVVRNPLAEQLKDLDTVPFPAYHMVDIERYFYDFNSWKESFGMQLKTGPQYAGILKKLGNKRKCMFIITSRGCTHACLFCYRHVKGVRQHSVDYVIKHMKQLKDKYGVEGFFISDELFNSNSQWVLDFCDALEKEKLDVVYIVGGARIDKMDEKMLRRLKETGCIQISYGQESGSDTILKEYRKGITSKQNKDLTQLTNDLGILCTVQLVIGAPSESDKTIRENIQFLKDLNAYQYSINYFIPFPETPIWKSVEEKGLIPDVEKYLDQVAEEGGRPIVNLTGSRDAVWRRWIMKIRKEMRLHYYKKKPVKYAVMRIFYFLEDSVLFLDKKQRIKRIIPARVKHALRNTV